MQTLNLLLAKVPFHLRSSFIEGVKKELHNEYNKAVVNRLVKNINKIDWDDYLIKHRDVKNNGYNPIVHYIYYGWKETRQLTILPDDETFDHAQKKILSCKQLRYGLVYENSSLYSCCAVNCGKRPFLARVNKDGTFNINAVISARRTIERELNTLCTDSVCSGCPLVEELPEYPSNDGENHYLCKVLNIGESHHCNFRCTYCVFNKKHMCGEPRRVTMSPIIKFMFANNLLAPDAYISIAGGEPLLMPDFDESINLLVESGEKNIILNTNLGVWSDSLANVLETGKVLIRCSIDSGTPETFARIKGRNLFWKVVENASRYAAIDHDKVLLKYICLDANCNDSDLLGILNILNLSKNKLLIDFDYYAPPDKHVMRFAGKFKALAATSGIDTDIRYDAELNWRQSIQLRRQLDAYELIYLNSIFKLSGYKLLHSSSYKSPSRQSSGYIDLARYNNEEGLIIQGWVCDHILGIPKSIRVYFGNRIIFVGKPNHIRLDIEAGAKAGFSFYREPNRVLKNIMASGGELGVYATFNEVKWDKIPFSPGATVELIENKR